MPTQTVEQGDHVSSIMAQEGFTDYKAVWDHPDNSQLKQDRQNPNVLNPGDDLYVPDKQTKDEPCQTQQKHRFRLKGKLKLQIVIQDHDGKPVANESCELTVGSNRGIETTDGKGLLQRKIKPTDKEGKLVLQTSKIDVPIKIGHLDPVDTVTGYKARLNNLGYDAGPLDEEDNMRLQMAIEEFQADYKKSLKVVDGICGPNTQKKLKEVHGC